MSRSSPQKPSAPNFHPCQRSNVGFTLIELLVVIFVIGVLASLLLTNLQGARQRAQDSRKKTELNNLKTALRLYYNDYQKYPEQEFGIYLPACGEDGTSRCPVCPTADFAAGGADGCTTVYMKDLAESGSTFVFRYYQCNDDDYRLKVELDNASDPDITTNQNRCPESCGSQTLSFSSTDYVLCAD